jgi:hypothetical protein
MTPSLAIEARNYFISNALHHIRLVDFLRKITLFFLETQGDDGAISPWRPKAL